MKELSIELTIKAIVSLKRAWNYLPAHIREKDQSLPLLIKLAEAHLKEMEIGLKER